MIDKKVALVTGANQGIGFAIVRTLSKLFNGDVILTARNEDRGKEAIDKLNQMGLKPLFLQLDISLPESVNKAKEYLVKNYGGLDILINNAGIAYKSDSQAPPLEQAHETLKINFWGTLLMCKAMLPIMKNHSRVVNVSSMCGCLKNIPSQEISDKFARASKDMTLEELEELMKHYEMQVKEIGSDKGKWEKEGWGNSHYGISKTGVTALTKILARDFKKHYPDKKDVLINCCCPGYVSTNMSSYKGHKTPEEGAETPVYLATLPPDNASNPSGEYLSDKKIAVW